MSDSHIPLDSVRTATAPPPVGAPLDSRVGVIEPADWLDDALFEAGNAHRLEYLSDDGFSARVVERLPQPAMLPSWRRPVVAGLWAVVGAAALVSLPGLAEPVFRGAVSLLVGHRFGVVDGGMALLVLASASWCGVAYVASAD